jgi:heme oxygenase (biliverdin-IX-beta and delta-forming)
MSVSERRFFLRAETAAAHRALDSALGQIHSREDYARYVRALTAFRVAVEPKIDITPFMADGFVPTQLRGTLEADCADLGLTGVRPVTSQMQASPETSFGVTYVLEGSALGAPFLYESAKQLGFHGEHGARHLAQQIGAKGNWGRFTVLLEAAPSLDMAQVSAAAIATFNLALQAAQDAVHV